MEYLGWVDLLKALQYVQDTRRNLPLGQTGLSREESILEDTSSELGDDGRCPGSEQSPSTRKATRGETKEGHGARKETSGRPRRRCSPRERHPSQAASAEDRYLGLTCTNRAKATTRIRSSNLR